MTFFSALLFLVSLVTCLSFLSGIRKLKRLEDCPAGHEGQGPLVSIIVPACNEEAAIAAGLRSLQEQVYPRLEIIVVNDRSSDSTATVVARQAAGDPRITLQNVRELPPGWLGKCHALHAGAARARGEFLLFTDADVCLERTVLSRAMARVAATGMDHLSLIFHTKSRNCLLQAMIVDGLSGLLLLCKPWRVPDRESKYFLGIGAFNLVRKQCYLQIGGHQALRMHPIDDIMLGKLLKEQGARSQCLLGGKLVQVPWYDSPGQMVDGLMKSAFCLYRYRLVFLGGALALIILGTVVPLWAPLLVSGPAALFFVLSSCCRLLLFAAAVRLLGAPACSLIYFPLTPFIMMRIVVQSAWTTLRHGGITWRGTFYPLEDLKKAPPLFTLGWLLRPGRR